jgi:hypothetical protein
MMGAAIDHFGGPQRSSVLSKEVLALIPYGSNWAVAFDGMRHRRRLVPDPRGQARPREAGLVHCRC